MTRPERRGAPGEPARRTNWTLIVLLGGLVLLVLVIAYLATSRETNPDSLTNAEVSTTSTPNYEKLCAAKPVYDAIKAELFRRAVQLRGSDQAAYDEVARAATIRMENPVMESENKANDSLHCSGSLSIDLPPGVAVADGRRTLMSDVDYSVHADAGGGGTLLALSDAEAIVTPLAKLVRVAEPGPSPEDESNTVSPEDEQANAPAPETAPAPAPSAAQPSFSCSSANTRSEAAICADPGLAALDRTMAAQYGRAIAGASPDERDLLRGTARRFYAYRDHCGDRQCIADAYVARMREIRDIMQGNWQGR